MCARWALVRRTLGIAGVALFSSADEEQPARSESASRPARLLLSTGGHEFGLVPPPSAKRLEQSGGVGEAVGLGLHLREARLLIGLVGVQHREIGGIAVLVLEAGEIEAG